MRFHRARVAVVGVAVALLVGACQSTPKSGDTSGDRLAVPAEFRPASSVSRMHLDRGRYPNLFSPRSYAVWVDEQVADAKRQQDLAGGVAISSSLDADASFVTANYIVFECFLESVFPDASIAYDVVGLRNLEVYLLTSDGTQVRPIQRIMGSHADEGQQGALKRFSRTNIVVFPKTDLLVGGLTIPRDAAGVRLMVEGFNSDFFFEWAPAPIIAEDGETVYAARQAEGAGRLSFSALYSKLRVLAHMFQ